MSTLWYGLSSLVFGIVLFFPVRHLILAVNINRHQRKTGRAITDEERQNLQRKVTVAAALIAISFAFLYNRFLFFQFFGSAP